ncbi:unnamed protein product [Rotaria sp. Silwood2]|nr:unnamed protein product [Rotaria sp. Silwood2]
MIVSGSLGSQILPEIQAWPQLESVYVFCVNKSVHEQWASTIAKVKGVHTQIDPIYKAIQIDHEHGDRAMTSINFNGIDTLFTYTQLLKETLLEIEDDNNESIKEFVDYCRRQDTIAEDQIDKVEHEYSHHTPIWWYTAPYFLYSTLNHGLRLMDVDIIVKMIFFIRHLYQHIEKLYRKQQSNKNAMDPFQVFRGQGLSVEDFYKMKQTKGGFMSFNSFLSTSRNREVSFEKFARPPAIRNPNLIGILFVMTIDPTLCAKSSIPFADITNQGFFEVCEEEILFTTHTIFRIDQIQRIHDDHTDRLWQVNLTLMGNDNDDLNNLTENIYPELSRATGWSRFGSILMKLGESSKAEKLYKILLEMTLSDKNRGDYNNQLGFVYYKMDEYSKALSSYEQSLEIRKKTLPPNHSDLAITYNSIGNVYRNIGEYSKALSFYEQSLEIQKIALPPNHPALTVVYDKIGNMHKNVGDFLKAISSYQQALEIKNTVLPPNHPNFAQSYNDIGSAYQNLREYSKALKSFEQTLEIWKTVLPQNDSELATSYNNIGVVYYNKGEYSKALSFLEKAYEIDQKTLPPNHPHIAQSKKNIENIKKKL